MRCAYYLSALTKDKLIACRGDVMKIRRREILATVFNRPFLDVLTLLFILSMFLGFVPSPATARVSLGNGWEAEYGTTNYYWHNGSYRLAYENPSSRWYDYGKTGWSFMAGGMSSQFIGDGNAHVIGSSG